jgi:hypothetical protein
MARVEIKVGRSGTLKNGRTFQHQPGDVIDVGDDQAERMIESGQCVSTKKPVALRGENRQGDMESMTIDSSEPIVQDDSDKKGERVDEGNARESAAIEPDGNATLSPPKRRKRAPRKSKTKPKRKAKA